VSAFLFFQALAWLMAEGLSLSLAPFTEVILICVPLGARSDLARWLSFNHDCKDTFVKFRGLKFDLRLERLVLVGRVRRLNRFGCPRGDQAR